MTWVSYSGLTGCRGTPTGSGTTNMAEVQKALSGQCATYRGPGFALPETHSAQGYLQVLSTRFATGTVAIAGIHYPTCMDPTAVVPVAAVPCTTWNGTHGSWTSQDPTCVCNTTIPDLGLAECKVLVQGTSANGSFSVYQCMPVGMVWNLSNTLNYEWSTSPGEFYNYTLTADANPKCAAVLDNYTEHLYVSENCSGSVNATSVVTVTDSGRCHCGKSWWSNTSGYATGICSTIGCSANSRCVHRRHTDCSA